MCPEAFQHLLPSGSSLTPREAKSPVDQFIKIANLIYRIPLTKTDGRVQWEITWKNNLEFDDGPTSGTTENKQVESLRGLLPAIGLQGKILKTVTPDDETRTSYTHKETLDISVEELATAPKLAEFIVAVKDERISQHNISADIFGNSFASQRQGRTSL